MKVAVAAAGLNLDSRVEHRLGTAPYLLIVDTDDMSFQAVEGPPASHGPGAGIQAVSLVLAQGARVIMAGFISPAIAKTLQDNGIETVTAIGGSVWEAIEKYKQGASAQRDEAGPKPVGQDARQGRVPWREAFTRAARQFFGILPVLFGVILLVGLLRAFMPRDFVLALFSGNALRDTGIGIGVGSLMTGNPINSYVIAESLREMGVSLYGVTALMLAWVSVWVVQLPVEIAALGSRFAVVRNGVAFLFAIPATFFIVWLAGGGG